MHLLLQSFSSPGPLTPFPDLGARFLHSLYFSSSSDFFRTHCSFFFLGWSRFLMVPFLSLTTTMSLTAAAPPCGGLLVILINVLTSHVSLIPQPFPHTHTHLFNPISSKTASESQFKKQFWDSDGLDSSPNSQLNFCPQQPTST